MEPVECIEWVDAAQLQANTYNPNMVFNTELRLLERSILKTGWTQPILISRDDIIIDGFHRWRLAQDSPALVKRYGGKVPCARLDVGPDEAMLLTIRMNRAKGTAAAFRMSAVIKRLIDEFGRDPQELAIESGGTIAEIDLLYQDSIFKARHIAEYQYSKAWEPIEVKK